MRGTVSGELSLDDLHKDARAAAQLDFDALQVGDVDCKASRLSASVEAGRLEAQASLDQKDGGFVVAQFRAGAIWGAGLLPQIDPKQPAVATLKAAKFRAEILRPWIAGLTELDGRIDASASIELDSEHEIVRPQGTLTLKDGVVELGWMGTEFRGMSAKVALTPDGIVRLQDFVAHGTSGTVTAAATAWMSGLSMGGCERDATDTELRAAPSCLRRGTARQNRRQLRCHGEALKPRERRRCERAFNDARPSHRVG